MKRCVDQKLCIINSWHGYELFNRQYYWVHLNGGSKLFCIVRILCICLPWGRSYGARLIRFPGLHQNLQEMCLVSDIKKAASRVRGLYFMFLYLRHLCHCFLTALVAITHVFSINQRLNVDILSNVLVRLSLRISDILLYTWLYSVM